MVDDGKGIPPELDEEDLEEERRTIIIYDEHTVEELEDEIKELKNRIGDLEKKDDKVTRCIKVHTLNTNVEISSEDPKDTLKSLKAIASIIIEEQTGW